MFNWQKTIHIVRGMPGEGKSTLGLSLVDGNRGRLIENDDYWYVPKEPEISSSLSSIVGPVMHHVLEHRFIYQYDRPLTYLAAQWCGAEAFRRLRIFDSVAVANVFARREHIMGYVDAAKKLEVNIKLHRPTTAWIGDVNECFNKNIHGVPLESLQMFKDQWEELSQEEIDAILHPVEIEVRHEPV